MKNILLVAQREYKKIVRKPSFWIATLLLPLFIGVVSYISGYSAERAEQQIREQVENAQAILIVDEAKLISDALIAEPLQRSNSLKEAMEQAKAGQVDATIYYPKDIASTQRIEVHAKDVGLIGRGRFNDVAQNLLKQSILLKIGDPALIALYNTDLNVDTRTYLNGEEVIINLEEFIVPGIILVLYFLLSMMSTNFLLLSVSEEKESRMIEILLSIMPSRHLIWGKIIGLVGVTVTQLIVLLGLSATVLWFTLDKLPFPIDLSAIPLDPVVILSGLFYLLCGFLLMATIMVGVGAAMPTYREAQSFSSIFIIASIFPVYFIMLIVQEPMGLLARILSYFPLTAPLILLGRQTLQALPTWEIVLSSLALIVYVAAGFWLAFKLFEFGSLEYDNRLSLKRLFGTKKNHTKP